MRRVLKGVLIGAVVAGCLASLDGAAVGLLLAGSTDVVLTAARWAVGFAVGGAAVGAIVGGLCGWLGERLVLRPPQEPGP